MKLYYNFLLLILATILITGFVSSQEIQTAQTVKINNCINVTQLCANCTFVNVTSIVAPNGARAISGNPISMTRQFYSEWNASFCQNNVIGEYIVRGNSNINGNIEPWTYNYFVNSLGLDNQGVYTFILVIIVVFLISLGVAKRDITLTLLGTFGLYFLGIWTLFYGFDVYKNYLTNGFAFIILGAAAYLSTIMAHEYIVD